MSNYLLFLLVLIGFVIPLEEALNFFCFLIACSREAISHSFFGIEVQVDCSI